MTFNGATFDWDVGNSLKCQKHGVSLSEIEFFLQELHWSLLMSATQSRKNGSSRLD
jgi:uncharacterized DUF497 family protein